MKKLYSLLVLTLVGLLVGSELFAATAPSIQASSIGFSSIGTAPNNHATILFRKGNGAKRVVVYSTAAVQTSATVAAALSNTAEYVSAAGDYSAGTTVGDYKVIGVLSGNARTLSLTNLPAGAGYVYVLEYNTDGSAPIVAYSTAVGTSNPRALFFPDGAVSYVAAGNLTATGATMKWNAVAGVSYYTLQVSTTTDLNVFDNGGFDSYDVGLGDADDGNESIRTWQVSGMHQGTTFYYRVVGHYVNGSTTDETGNGTFTTLSPTFTFDTDVLSNITDELEWSIDGGTVFTPAPLGQVSKELVKAQREAITAANDIIVRNIETPGWTTTINIVDDLIAPSTTVNFIDETTTDALDNTVEYYVDVNAADAWLTTTGNTCSGSVVSVQPNANGGVSKYFHYRTKGTGLSMPKPAVAALEIPVRPATPTSPTCLIAIATENMVFNFQNSAAGLEVQKNAEAWADATISASGFMDAPALTLAVDDVVNARVKAVAATSFHSANLTTTAKARPFAPSTATFTFTPGADQYKLQGVTDAMEWSWDAPLAWTAVPALATEVALDATAETKGGILVRYKQNCTASTAISSDQTITFVAGADAPAFCAADADGDVLVGLTPNATDLEANIDGGVYYPVDVNGAGEGYITNDEFMVPFGVQTINVRVVGNGLTKSGATTTHVGDSRAAAPAVTAAFVVDGSGVDVLRVSGADATMEYTLEHNETPWISFTDANPLDIPLSSINYGLGVRVKCNAGTPPSDEMFFNVLENETVPTISIADATEDKLFGLPANADGMEARIGTTGAWTAISPDENGIADVSISMPFTSGMVIYVRYASEITADPNYFKPSASASVTSQDEAAAPSVTFTFTAGATANQLVGTSIAMEYSLDGGDFWYGCDDGSTELTHANIDADNDIRVRFGALAPTPYSHTTTFNILAGPAAPSFDLADAARDLLFGLPASQALGVLEANLEATAYSAIETNAAGQATFGCNLGDNVHVRYAAHDLTLESDPATQVAVNPPAFAPDVAGNPDFSFDDYDGMNPWVLINLNTTMEYSVDGGITWTAATGATADLTGSTITPAFDILVRNEVAPPVAASQNYTIDIIDGGVTPAHNINFTTEVLSTNATDEFALDAAFTTAYGSGEVANLLLDVNYAIPNAPAADKVAYIREMPTYHTTAKTAIQVTIPARPVGPSVSIDYEYEVTAEEFTSAVEWSNHGLDTWYSPTDPNVEYAEVVPGTDMDFRTKATGTAFKSQIALLTVAPRPVAPAFTIDYVNERTIEVVSDAYEYATTTMAETLSVAGTVGPNTPLGLTPGQNLWIRQAATNNAPGNFYGVEQPLVVKPRQAVPATVYAIDYEYETTDVAVPAVEEYADNADFTGAVSGNDVDPANLNPEATAKTIYFRTKAIPGSEFHSDAITLAVPARPAAPTVNYTVNYLTEMTNEPVANTLEWDTDIDFTSPTAGEDLAIEALPSTTYYFRYPWTAGSFGSSSDSYTTPDRPMEPAFTIDYINEATIENAATTIEYGFSEAYGFTGSDAIIPLTPEATAKTLFARIAAVAGLMGNYSGTPQELTIPARPVAVGVGINYLTEETTGPFDDTYEWGYTNAFGNMCDGAHNIPLAPGAVAHDFFLRKAASQGNENFAGFTTSIVIPARPAAPAAYSIDYVAETTIEPVPTTEEYSTDDFATAGTPGTGVAITVTPGTTLNFRVAASEVAPNFCSVNTPLVVPARPVYAITANGFATFTPRDPKPELDASVNGTGTLYWLHAEGPAVPANILDEKACTTDAIVGTSLYDGANTTTYQVAFRPSVGGFITLPVSQKVTVYTAPTTNATALNFEGLPEDGSIPVYWTNGDGTNVMIVRQTGNDVTFVPVNGTTYTTGQDIDANTKVIYAGLNDIDTYTDAAATASTSFAYRAFAFNGVNGAYIYNATTSTYNPWMPLYLTGTATPISPSTSIESGKSYKLTVNPIYRDGTAHTMAALSSRTINIEATGTGVTAYSPATTTLVAGENKKEITNATITAANGSTDVVVNLEEGAKGYFVADYVYSIAVGNVMCAEPTAQATYVVFGTSSCSGPGGTRNIQVKFTKPTTGAGAIVVAKQSTSLNEVPVDGETYGGTNDKTQSISYAAAPAFGALGAKAMFNFNDVQTQYTSGDALQMTNLTASSQVRVRVYMYNGSGATTNYFSNAGTFNPRSATLSACRQGESGSICELSGFRARSSMGSVITNWNVAEENMVVGYTLERAEAIGENPEFAEVTSYVSNNDMAGSLTESANKSYNFVDRSADLRVGKDYLYRLSYTDVNGEKQQLAEDMVTVVNMNTEGDQMLSVNNVRANGNTLNFDLELAQSLGVTVQIVDMTGMSVSTQINGKVYPAGETKLSLDIQNLTSGTYFLNVSSANGEAVVEKFVVVK